LVESVQYLNVVLILMNLVWIAGTGEGSLVAGDRTTQRKCEVMVHADAGSERGRMLKTWSFEWTTS
jgi:hypothetical protein